MPPKKPTEEQMEKAYDKIVSLLDIWQKQQSIWKKAGDQYSKLYKIGDQKYNRMLKVVDSSTSSATAKKRAKESYKKAVRAENQALKQFKAEGVILTRVGKPCRPHRKTGTYPRYPDEGRKTS